MPEWRSRLHCDEEFEPLVVNPSALRQGHGLRWCAEPARSGWDPRPQRWSRKISVRESSSESAAHTSIAFSIDKAIYASITPDSHQSRLECFRCIMMRYQESVVPGVGQSRSQ